METSRSSFEQEPEFSSYPESPDTVWDEAEIEDAAIEREIAEDSLAEEAIMQVAALESDRPTEGEIERSHEVKKDQAQGLDPQQDIKHSRLAQIARVVTRLTSPEPAAAEDPASEPVIAQNDEPDDSPVIPQLSVLDQPSPSLYRQAVRHGFMAAAIILVIFSLLALLL